MSARRWLALVVLCVCGLAYAAHRAGGLTAGRTWGSTPGERERAYPCDGLIAGEAHAIYRAVTVAAPAELVYRWLCQLRAAPYSYDWVDNFGRTSPQDLSPGLERLVAGVPVMTIFELVAFEDGRHLTMRLRDRWVLRQVFGAVALTYAVEAETDDTTRLVAKVSVRYPRTPLGWLVRAALPWGDLVMMRRQLLNLKRLAERDAGPPGAYPA